MQNWYKEVFPKKLSLNGRNTSRIRYLPPAFSPSPQIPSHPLQLLSSAIRHIESLRSYFANLILRDFIYVFLSHIGSIYAQIWHSIFSHFKKKFLFLYSGLFRFCADAAQSPSIKAMLSLIIVISIIISAHMHNYHYH